ncbi:Formate dehydrogenase-O iron-sulfur subunit, partial [Haemophilus influenzae]
SSKRSSN